MNESIICTPRRHTPHWMMDKWVKTPHGIVKTFHPCLRRFSILKHFHYQAHIAIFKFCAIPGIMETQLVCGAIMPMATI